VKDRTENAAGKLVLDGDLHPHQTVFPAPPPAPRIGPAQAVPLAHQLTESQPLLFHPDGAVPDSFSSGRSNVNLVHGRGTAGHREILRILGIPPPRLGMLQG